MGGQAPDSSLPKEQPVDHAAVVFPRELVGVSCLSRARACARGKGRSAVDPAGAVSLPERQSNEVGSGVSLDRSGEARIAVNEV